MSAFRHVCLLHAPQAFPLSHPYALSSLTELCYLAAAVEPDVETVSIPVDFLKERAFADFSRHLETRPVDLVGISSMTGAFSNALRLARLAKRRGAYVVMGGYHPSALPEETLGHPEVDAVVIGEGEETLRELVLQGPSPEIDGLAYRDDGRIIKTKPRRPIADLDALPQPLRRIRPIRFGEAGDAYSTDTVYTSRGCLWNCAYCANALVHGRWRARSPENVIEELASLHDPKRKKLVKVWDANFLTDPARVERICDLMIERRLLNFRLWTEARVDDVIRAEPILSKLVRVGLDSVNLGLESPKAETLGLLKKGTSPEMNRRAVEILKKNGITPKGYFIIGVLNDTPADVRSVPEYAESLGLREAVFMVMTPYPGTAVFGDYERAGRIRTKNWDLFNNFTPVVETEAMDDRTLKRMFAYCWGRFYAGIYFQSHRRKAVLWPVFGKMIELMIALYNVCRSDPSNSDDDIREYLYEFLKSQTDRVLSVTLIRRPSRVFRWLKVFAVRFRKSPAESITFYATPVDSKVVIIAREEKNAGPGRGPTIPLREMVRLAGLIPSSDVVFVVTRITNWKLNAPRRLRENVRFFSEKTTRRTFRKLAMFALQLLAKGASVAFFDVLSGRSLSPDRRS